MNRKRKGFRVLMLMVCMIALMGIQPMTAHAAEPTIHEVYNYGNLVQVINYFASDGDVIMIMNSITVSPSTNAVVGDPNKHVTLKRKDASVYFNISTTSEVTFQNVTFDGDGIQTGNAYVIPFANVIFQDCTFKNCITETANGGAVYVVNNTSTFRNCTFDNNTGVQGGHMYIANGANAVIENSTFVNGHALVDGGAIKNTTNPPAACRITSSIIKDNSAGEYGGGFSTTGYAVISGTKIYDNTATAGGADIARFSMAFSMYDSLELPGLLELYKDDEFVPTGWVNDYDAEAGVVFPTGYDLTSNYILMKLDYVIPPTEVVLDAASLGTADDGKVTGLESGKYYKVTAGEVVSYSKADGTSTAIESEASPLLGNEITGLTNGETYLVEEFTPAPTRVLLDSESLGTAADSKITGLETGKLYMVTQGETISYSKSDGTLTLVEAEAEALVGTEILGLTNGETYLVEEYTPAPVEPPVEEEPVEEPGTIILDAASLGTAGDGKISELIPGKTYKVIVIAYVKADGTLTTIESEAEPLTGTDILGLTNGNVYKVEEYPSVAPEPLPEEEPEPEEPVDQEEEPTPTPTPDPTPSSNSGSSHSHSNSTPVVTVAVKPEVKPAVTLSNGKAVLDTTKAEYLLGYAAGRLGGKDAVSRAEAAQIVYGIMTADSRKAIYSETNSFKDVPLDAWYNAAVSTIAKAGIITGSGDGNFSPERYITWGEMATIFTRFVEPRTDVRIITEHWARGAINTAISLKWIDYNDKFDPNATVTIDEMIAFIEAAFAHAGQETS